MLYRESYVIRHALASIGIKGETAAESVSNLLTDVLQKSDYAIGPSERVRLTAAIELVHDFASRAKELESLQVMAMRHIGPIIEAYEELPNDVKSHDEASELFELIEQAASEIDLGVGCGECNGTGEARGPVGVCPKCGGRGEL